MVGLNGGEATVSIIGTELQSNTKTKNTLPSFESESVFGVISNLSKDMFEYINVGSGYIQVSEFNRKNINRK